MLEARHGSEDGERFSWPGAPHQTRLEARGEALLSKNRFCMCVPGEDYEGKPTHRNRDVWVIRVEIDFWQRGVDTGCDARSSMHDIFKTRYRICP